MLHFLLLERFILGFQIFKLDFVSYPILYE